MTAVSGMRTLVALEIRLGRIIGIDVADGAIHTLTEAAGPNPDGVVAIEGGLYWTTMGEAIVDPAVPGERGRDYSRRDGGVHGLPPGAQQPVDIVPSGGLTTGKQLAYDGVDRLYWGDREGCKVSRVCLDGTGLEDVVVNDRADGILAQCVGVAVDRAGGYFYWTQKGPPKGGLGRILRAGIDLAVGETAADRSDIEVLWAGLPEPIDLEIVGGRLYWTDRGAEPAGNTLNRAPIPAPGELGGRPEILAAGFREAIGLAVDEVSGYVYVSDLSGDITVIPLPDGQAAGKALRVLVSRSGPVSGLAVLD